MIQYWNQVFSEFIGTEGFFFNTVIVPIVSFHDAITPCFDRTYTTKITMDIDG